MPTYYFAQWLTHRWLPGLEGWPLLGVSVAIGALSFAFAFASAFAGAGPFAAAVAGGLAAAGATFGAAAVLAPIAGVGLALRGLCFRVAATLRYLPPGFGQLPENWRENNFLTDSFLPAELLPGIREVNPLFSLDGLGKAYAGEQDRDWRVFYPLLGFFLFVPAFLYRLNIKATAWFWWPLAYLLQPAPVAEAEAQEKQALCWPWTNPFQKLWIGVSVLLTVVSLTLHNGKLAAWLTAKDIPALPLALKVSLAIDWAHLAPWHWAQWLIAGAGAGMLWLAGNARSHDVTGNWAAYRLGWPWNIRLMTGLQRVRALATGALLVMALGALLLESSVWQAYVSVPESWVRSLERFYRLKQ